MMRALLLLLTGLLLAASLRAEEAGVHASFSPASAHVGETVRYVLEVTGGDELDQQPRIKVDGLEFRYTGASQQLGLQSSGGRLVRTSTTSYIYDVTPRRAGDFTVPGLVLSVGGRQFTTQPVALSVREADATDRTDRSAFAEVYLPKKTMYVGETVAAELRLFIDEHIVWQLEAPPTFEAEAFTKTKLGESRPSSVVRNGKTFDVVSLRTALTPTKAGKLTAGPVTFQYLAQIPRAEARQPRRFGNSLFDRFFGDPMSGLAQTQRMRATSDLAEVEVKPLPISGRPASFSGAVGQFRMHAQGSPTRVKMGDPITMNVVVSGTGNFDRVNAPILTDGAGWRSYPPTATYKGDDNLGMNGSKSFEIAIIPEVKKQMMPVFEFSYFDPVSGEYQTLQTEPSPLQVEGDAPLPAAPESRGPTRVPAGATPAPVAPVVKPTDIVGIRYDLGPLHNARPLYTQTAFLLVQVVPFGLLCGMMAVRFWPRDRAARHLAALRRERSALQAQLRRGGDRAGFYAAAVRLLQVDAALRTGQEPEAIHPAALGENELVREICATHEQVRYSGATAGTPEELPVEERHRVLNGLIPLLNRK